MSEVVCLPLDGELLRTERHHAPAYDAQRASEDDYMLCLVMRDDLWGWLNEHTDTCKQRWSEHGVEFVFERQSEADDFCRFLQGLGSVSGEWLVQPRSRHGAGRDR
jgi:hypothetical protein